MPRPDRHRAELVTATARLLRRQGYTGTSVAEFLRAGGAANGSLYHHFPGGKEELALAAIDAAGAQVEASLEVALGASEDIAAATQVWIDGLIAALREDPRDGCPIAPTAIEAAAVSEPLRAASAEIFSRWATVLERALARTRDPQTASSQALVLLSAIEGALLLDRTTRETTHLTALRDAVPTLLGA
jgi:TetR/AcrR family transcriptional repressor of lmrAB and yxaGH operons